MKDSWVIFDLDGTLADIGDRRKLSTKDNGKMDWVKFFDPQNIDLDKPNNAVIRMAQVLHDPGLTRFVFIILFLYPGTPAILIYLIFWLIMEKN